jgi:methyl-accepting chemotaxis protein
MIKIQNISIIAKIAIPGSFLAMVAMLIVLAASWSMTQLSVMASDLVDKNAARLRYALQAESSFNSAAVSEKNVILNASDKADAQANIALYNKASESTIAAIDHYEAITKSAEQRQLAESFRAAVGERETASAHIFELVLSGKTDQAFDFSRTTAAAFRRQAADAAAKLIAMNVEQMQAAREESAAMASKTRLWLIAGALLGLACGFSMLGWISLYQISKPLTAMSGEMKKLASGDLDILIDGVGRGDEIGTLAQALKVFHENAILTRRLEDEQRAEQQRKEARQQLVERHIREFDAQVRGALDILSAASTEMNATANSMSSTAEMANQQAGAVAATASETLSNVQTVAAATEQLHVSIEEISRQVTQSADIAGAAVTEADRTNSTIEGLAQTAQKINEVVTLIQSIASQTNLLALNATIEAARAGDAGKGFAVVAGEVKLLANQTARATEDISAQVSAIQAETGQAVAAIKAIGSTIRQMSEIASAIAAAVEQQGAATRDISQNIQEVARGTAEVSTSIARVNDAAEQTGAAAMQVLSASGDLGRQANSLSKNVDGFFANIRAS